MANPAGNVAPRWVYQAILVEMTDKTLYGLRATQRHKEIRGIFNGCVSPFCDLTEPVRLLLDIAQNRTDGKT